MLLNSNNTVSNGGTISNSFGTGATGITIVPGYTGSVTNSGTINVITTGTAPTTSGQYGILLMNGNNVNFNGTAANASTSLTTSNVIGLLSPGELVSSATGFTTGTYVVSQSSGTPGGAGVYVLSQPDVRSFDQRRDQRHGIEFRRLGIGHDANGDFGDRHHFAGQYRCRKRRSDGHKNCQPNIRRPPAVSVCTRQVSRRRQPA